MVKKIEKQEELRCMDYIYDTKTLFIGTNQKNILTENIDILLNPLINDINFD